MSTQNTGGPAFPCVPKKWFPDAGCFIDDTERDCPGMTLRDWFAGQALSGILSGIEEPIPEGIAGVAYAIAEAMIERRKT